MQPDLLPAQQPPGQDGTIRQAISGEPDGYGNPATRVLYVDDEPDLLELGKLFLEDSGEFSVTTATGAPLAIQLLEKETFDAIISDYQMPVMDGIQFLSAVRARFGRVPFILFTGKGREEVVIQAINQGVDFYLQKGGDVTAQFAELALKIRQATSRRKAEDILRKREEDYQHLIEHSDEAIGIIQDGLIRRVNASVVALTGYAEEELLSVPFLRFIHPDDQDLVKKRYEMRMTGEQPPSQYSIRLVQKSGRVIWIEISTVIITWKGRPATIAFLVNITRRIEAEEALVQAKEYLDQILNTIPDPVFVKDQHRRRVLANDAYCKLLGLERKDVINKSDQELHPPEIADNLAREDDMVFASGRERDREEEIRNRDGNRYIMLTRKNLLEDRQGKKYIVGISRDITGHKQADEEVLRTRQNYKAFFDSIGEFLYVLDNEGRILFANETVFRRLGYEKDELAGQSVLMVHPADQREEAARIVHEMLAGTTSCCRVPVMTKGGQLIPVETRVTRGIWDGKPALFGVCKEISGPCSPEKEV